MANNATPPFFQLGRRIVLQLWQGQGTDTLEGEVMDTDVGWLAVRNDATGTVEWYNLRYVISIRVLGPTEPA